jgi:hypothetical protein
VCLGGLLDRRGRTMTVVVGTLALPVGAFLYGVVLSMMGWVTAGVIPIEWSRDPIGTGTSLASVVMAPLTLILSPAAIWTTYQLRSLCEPHA